MALLTLSDAETLSAINGAIVALSDPDSQTAANGIIGASIGGRSIQRMSFSELLKWKQVYEAKVRVATSGPMVLGATRGRV